MAVLHSPLPYTAAANYTIGYKITKSSLIKGCFVQFLALL